jgi:hypothetical protein
MGIFLACCIGLVNQGCGLSEYESRMEEQQERMNYMDEENKNLDGNILQVPGTKVDDKVEIPPNHFYCRPPKGISPKPREQKLGDLLYVFPGSGSNPLIRDMLAAIVKTDGTNKFVEEVLQALGGMSGTRKYRDLRPPGRAGMHLETYEEATPDLITDVYFYKQDTPYEVALAFRLMPKAATDSSAKERINYCLGSLRAGSLAYEMHKTYKPLAPTQAPAQLPSFMPVPNKFKVE